MNRPSLILASSSSIRRQMLDHAGVAYEARPADIVEGSIKSEYSDAASAATALAIAKAEAISRTSPDTWVIGSDSIVSVDGDNLDKPKDRDDAAAHLRRFSGKPLILTSAVALARGGKTDWSYCGQAALQVRRLSDDFIQAYLDQEWPEVAYCVGVFRLEALGVTLFDRIDGDYFTILGMPLLPLLAALRERGAIPC